MSMNVPQRNDPCPCGSGKKYKKCCLRREETQHANMRQAASRHRGTGQGSSPTSDDWKFHLKMGNAYYGQGNFVLAVESYQRALALAPDNATAHFQLGCALLNQGKAENAVACYEKAIALKPDYFDAYLNLANTYLNLDKAAAAVASCQRALALKPASAAAYLTQGLAYFALDDFDAGVTSCRHGLACKPDCNQLAMAHYLNNIGAAYSKQGRLEEDRHTAARY